MPNLAGYEWYWEAYADLTTCRQIGMAEGPIPWTAIQMYAEVKRLDEVETWMLHEIIRRVDSRQMARKAEQRELENRKSNAKSNAKSKPSGRVTRMPRRGRR